MKPTRQDIINIAKWECSIAQAINELEKEGAFLNTINKTIGIENKKV